MNLDSLSVSRQAMEFRLFVFRHSPFWLSRFQRESGSKNENMWMKGIETALTISASDMHFDFQDG